jgi:hypothetical protein
VLADTPALAADVNDDAVEIGQTASSRRERQAATSSSRPATTSEMRVGETSTP